MLATSGSTQGTADQQSPKMETFDNLPALSALRDGEAQCVHSSKTHKTAQRQQCGHTHRPRHRGSVSAAAKRHPFALSRPYAASLPGALALQPFFSRQWRVWLGFLPRRTCAGPSWTSWTRPPSIRPLASAHWLAATLRRCAVVLLGARRRLRCSLHYSSTTQRALQAPAVRPRTGALLRCVVVAYSATPRASSRTTLAAS